MQTNVAIDLAEVQLDLDAAIYKFDLENRQNKFNMENSAIEAQVDLSIAKFNEVVALDAEERRIAALRKQTEIDVGNYRSQAKISKIEGQSALTSSFLSAAGTGAQAYGKYLTAKPSGQSSDTRIKLLGG